MARGSKTARSRRAARAVDKALRNKRNAKSNLGALVEALRNVQSRGAGAGLVEGVEAAAGAGYGMMGMTEGAAAEAGLLPMEAEAAAGGGVLKGMKGKGSALKGIGSSLLVGLILQKLMNIPSEIGERNLRREGIQSQMAGVSAENMIAQAALPQAREEEAMARQALMAQLSGGVIGPQLTRGERLIGGG